MELKKEEQRKAERYKAESAELIFELKLPDRIAINNGKIYDVSYIGMGIASLGQLPEIGSIVTLDFRLFPEKDSIISLAKVVWVDLGIRRFGVEFVTPSEEFMKNALENISQI